MSEWIVENFQISIRRDCKFVLLARSIYYYIYSQREDRLIRMRINEISNTLIRFGFRGICTLLRREGFDDNHKRKYRIYKEEDLNLIRKRPRRNQSGTHNLERLENSGIHKVWSMDFLQDSLYNGSKFRVLSIVDNFSKKCLLSFVGKSLKGR